MPDTVRSSGDTYSEAETVARREAALKRAFATPHRPHKQQPREKAEARPRGRSGEKEGKQG